MRAGGRANRFHGQFIIARDADVLAELAQVLHEIPGEGIVVVDH